MENSVVLLTIPPHTSHRLQPLDRAAYGPYIRAYAKAMDEWMRSNPGKTLSIYDVPALVKEAQISTCVPCNVLAGFQSTGIYPYSSNIFTDDKIAPAKVTDRQLLPAAQQEQVQPMPNCVAVQDQPTQADQPARPAPAAIQPAGPAPAAIAPATDEPAQSATSSDSEPAGFVPAVIEGESATGYVSPRDVIPSSKAGPQKQKPAE